MFEVLFEIHPKPDQFNAYLGYAKMLLPELTRLDGFVGVVRYRSLTREGWILSLSSWRDEKAIACWRTTPTHREVQAKGRSEVFLDYRIRVSQVTRDTQSPDAGILDQERLDRAETTDSPAATLIDAKRTAEWVRQSNPQDIAGWLGLDANAKGLVAWDVFEAVLTPGDIILLISWRDEASANIFENLVSLQDGARLRGVRVVRDYGMFDRREVPH
jgi:heme-degrading monooxygenase HmoA